MNVQSLDTVRPMVGTQGTQTVSTAKESAQGSTATVQENAIQPATHTENTAKEQKENREQGQSGHGTELKSYDDDRKQQIARQLENKFPNSKAKYGVHEATQRIMITVVDKDTNEVIREIPPEKTLDLLAEGLERAGVLVDEKL